MKRPLFEAKFFAPNQHHGIVGVDVCLAVAAAVEHNRVLEHRSFTFGGVRQLGDELSQKVCLELVVLAKFNQIPTSFAPRCGLARWWVTTEPESDRYVVPLAAIHALQHVGRITG